MKEVNKNKPIKVTLKMAIVISIIIIVVTSRIRYKEYCTIQRKGEKK